MPDEALRLRIAAALELLYGRELAPSVLAGLESSLGRAAPPARQPPALSERSAVLLCFPDQVHDGVRPPLAVLADLLERTCGGLIERVHLLPFHPATSQEPLSVTDPFGVDPRLGTPSDLESLGRRFSLMCDVPLCSLSTASEWFRRHAAGEASCAGLFLRCDPYADYSAAGGLAERPLLAAHDTSEGPRWFWSSLGGDTADLNYRDPSVLLAALEFLLFHAGRGAGILRLRGTPFLWKTAGTSCAGLPETHAILRLLRACLDTVCPRVLLASDSDFSPEEDFSYFGGGEAECQLADLRPLPLLAAHALLSGDARPLSGWADTLRPPGPGSAYMGLTASHEGLLLRHASPWLDEARLAKLLRAAEEHGGQVRTRAVDGEAVPEDLHISYFDLVTALGDPDEAAARKFLLSQAIMLSMPGVPVVYFHALFGSRNFWKGFAAGGDPAILLRERLAVRDLLRGLEDPGCLRSRVFAGYSKLLRARVAEPAFHPSGPFRFPALHPNVFSVERGPRDGGLSLLSLANVDSVAARVPLRGTCLEGKAEVKDLLSGCALRAGEPVEVPPLSALWLK